jgi:glycosyltransferase involved in cell wall biosynthesis/predicted SAM-dependent methyltransferase
MNTEKNDMNSDEQKLTGALRKIFSGAEWLQQKTIVRIGGQVHPFLERLIANHRIINVDISSSYIQTQYRLDIQADAHELPMIPDGSVDMIVSSHTLEHLTNPVKALKEWRRILRDTGILCLAVPYYKKTFDHKRNVTTLPHFINDYQTNVGLDDASHTQEFLENFDITKDFCFNSYDVWHKNYLTNPQIYTHYHVFDLETVRTLCEFAGFETDDVFYRDIGVDYFGRKVSGSTKVSIAIPCYEMHGKGVEFLNYSFSRIHAQTYKNVEVVISDHSQNDDIQKLCEKWKSLLKIVYVRFKEKRGSSSANLNNALRRCSGEIVKVLFQDDFLFHEKSIEDIVGMFHRHPDKHWLVTASEHTKDGISCIRPFLPSYNDLIHLGNNTISSPSVLAFRNKDVLYFDETLIWLMDCDYYKRLRSRFGEPLVLDHVNVVNRLWESQVSALLNEEVKNEEILRMRDKYKTVGELKRGKIYIAVPYRYETGGVEALHQLAHKLNLSGFDSFLLYKSSAFSEVLSGGRPPSGVYDGYKANEALDVEDSPDNILIVPEVWTKLLDKYKRIRKCIWWLSVDNNLRSPEGGYQSWGDKNVIHLFQSYYAAEYVRSHGADGYYLSEYLNKNYLTQSRDGLCRKNIVLYNPAKGLQATQAIIHALRQEQIEFIPLKGFNAQQLQYLYGISKVYIDFGSHPGMDRIPREAAIGGCCVIVGKNGAANNAMDIPIPGEYKIDGNDIELAAVKIKECVKDYETRSKDFEEYKYIVSKQEQKMEEDVLSAFSALMPAQERKHNLCLIFSKDRAMQLQATIESFVLHCKDNNAANIVVLFKASNPVHKRQYDELKKKFPVVAFVEETDFRKQVLSIVDCCEYVLFLVDDNIFVKPFSLRDVIAALDSEKNAIGFSLRLGKNTDYCYSLSSPQKLPEFKCLSDGILKYNWPGAECDFGYPLEVSSSVYRSNEILSLLNKSEFSSPNTLESAMYQNRNTFVSTVPFLLTFEKSVTFCNPVNVVQSECKLNRFGTIHSYTSGQLADCLSRGMAIDVQKYVGFTPDSAHQEVELHFTPAERAIPGAQLTRAGCELKPKFSVVMASYNNAKFTAQAIESVLSQTLKDWELIIIDDCSTDDSVDVIKRYLTDDRIRLIRHDVNKGYVAALKAGIADVRSDIFGILDSDDCLVAHAVQIMYRHHIYSPDCGFIYSQFMNCDENLVPKHPGFCREIPSGKTTLDVNVVSHFKTFKLRDYLRTHGYDESILYAEDKDIIHKMEEVTRLKFVDDCLYLYRELPHSLSHDAHKMAIGIMHRERAKAAACMRREKNIEVYEIKDNPLVSIWMAAYNGADYIARAIESVLIQNYRNFELIVVDDGSTDRTAEIVRSFKNEPIKYFYKENGGLASARNVQLQKSSGSFVVTLDCDDMMTPDFIARHLQVFEQNPETDLVYCDDCFIDDNDKPICVMRRPEYSDQKTLISDMFRCAYPVVPFRTCIRKSVFDKIGLYDERLRVSEDYDMMRRFVSQGLKVCHLPAAIYLRRPTTGSLSRSFNTAKAKSLFEVIRRLTETFTPEQLFPKVHWENLPVEQKQLLAKCKTALAYLGHGELYLGTNAPDFAEVAFEMACATMDDCCEIEPGNQQVRDMREKCLAIRAKHLSSGSRGVYQTV